MTVKEIEKPFEYLELKAMCILAATQALFLYDNFGTDGFMDPKQGRLWLENKIEEIIRKRWDHPDKKAIE